MEIRMRKAYLLGGVAVLLGGAGLGLAADSAQASTPHVGRYCSKAELGKRVGNLVCVDVHGSRFWKIVRKPAPKPTPTPTVTVTLPRYTVTVPGLIVTTTRVVPTHITETTFVECDLVTPSPVTSTNTTTRAGD